jgi:predicted aspartyl protease
MPHFTLQIGPEGPMLNAMVVVSAPRQAWLTQAKQPIPAPVKIRALVDTGASGTCIDPMVMAQLGLTPTNVIPMLTPTTGATPVLVEQFDVGLIIPGQSAKHAPLAFHTTPVVASALYAAQGFHALIGRDILRHCILNYNGDFGYFSLGY